MRLFRSILLAVLLASTVPAAVMGAVLLRRGAGPEALWLHGALALALAVALSAWCARRIAGPLSACVRGALEIARGRFGREVPVDARHEVGDLAYAFNHMSRELASYDAENRRLISALEAGYLSTLRSLVSAIDAKDPSTRGHSQRVSELALGIGEELGLPPATLQALSWGGLLHDIGKIGVPESILHKAGSLSGDELRQMRDHPVIGAEILRGVEFLVAAAPAVRHHHERWDGQGYPDGLAGADIPLIARVVNAADTFDACTSARPYQPPLTLERTLEVVQNLKEKQIDPEVCDALVRLADQAVTRGPRPSRAGGTTGRDLLSPAAPGLEPLP